ncbi:NADH-quinone oxidoreductase subunit C [Streptomyces sp. NBC_01803]|uniref:NADH-quinone oxidoreductase subunit C n=1 Tax=Streptomyces sp. NBC_01803 TaxID=2975946 RepID=UPI002DDAFAD5|nr:NADH-quinone oxidoreductase subunit C [Streptomyces sp. NBC_01803]WSA45733.1 NADH-quinone oxidoreductase subunit C [Streptomyces sp. NBC_01803]
MTVGWLPRPAAEIFGEGAEASEAYEVLTVDVPPAAWPQALRTARDELGCAFFDWLSAVDEPGTGFRVCAHVAALGTPPRRLLLRTTVPHENPALPTVTGVYAGASWHERETHEMFGIDFPGHPELIPLLLPENFEGHPLRKDFVLAARVAKAWPGAKEPGESAHGGPKRRQMLPPGVPDPNEWGPLKGQLPDLPAARPPRRTGASPPEGRAASRRSRTAGEGSASQRDDAPEAGTTASAGEGRPASRPDRSAGEGSMRRRDDAPEAGTTASAGEGRAASRRSRMAGEGSASQRDDAPEAGGETSAAAGRPTSRRDRSAGEGSASRRDDAPEAGTTASAGEGRPASRPDRSTDEDSASREAGSASAGEAARRRTDVPWNQVPSDDSDRDTDSDTDSDTDGGGR